MQCAEQSDKDLVPSQWQFQIEATAPHHLHGTLSSQILLYHKNPFSSYSFGFPLTLGILVRFRVKIQILALSFTTSVVLESNLNSVENQRRNSFILELRIKCDHTHIAHRKMFSSDPLYPIGLRGSPLLFNIKRDKTGNHNSLCLHTMRAMTSNPSSGTPLTLFYWNHGKWVLTLSYSGHPFQTILHSMHGPWTTSLTSDEYIFFSHFEGCIS
jgi:hypothetical protein